jgi:hypothetical protein
MIADWQVTYISLQDTDLTFAKAVPLSPGSVRLTLRIDKMMVKLILYAAVALSLAYLALIFPRVSIIHQ